MDKKSLMKKYFFYCCAILLIIIIPVCITEIYLRIIGLGDPITYDSNYVYGYAPKENQSKKRLKNSRISINDVGLRSLFNWSQNSKKKKIVFFGDSVTYGGSYIDDKEIFSHLVCKNLNLENYICGNAGVNSYGIINIVYRSRYDERINRSDIKIFVIIPDDFYRGLQNSNTAHFYLNDQKFLLPAIFEAVNFVTTKYDINNFIAKYDNTEKYNNQKELINEAILLLSSEVERLKNNNEKFLLFYSAGKNNNNLKKYILKKLKSYINSNIIELTNILKDDMFEDSSHLNKKGHKAVSMKIAEEIDNLINSY